MSKEPRRKRKRSFNFAAIRRREIERHARDVGAADTEDYWRWLVAWAWHNATSKDQVGALENISEKMGRELGPSEIDEILDLAKTTRQRRTADALAKFLGITYERRQRLKLTTIGAIDIGRRERKELRKHRQRIADEQRRRANGAEPRAEYRATSRTATKPWEVKGMTRRTWYRKQAVQLGTGPHTAIPTLTKRAENGTSPRAAILSSGVCGPVPSERKQVAFQGEALAKARAATGSRTNGQTAERVERNRRETADPGAGWLRSRFMGEPWPRGVAACGRHRCAVCGPAMSATFECEEAAE
jgi:hypothetical protein